MSFLRTALYVALAAATYALLFGIKENVNQGAVERHNVVVENITAPDTAVAKIARSLAIPAMANPIAPNHISNPAPFQQMHSFLHQSYSTVFKTLSVEKIADYSLVLTWKGSDASLHNSPIILMSHMDVVPAPEYNTTSSTSAAWKHPPFSGTVDSIDGYIYGRGALDVKSSLCGILEAVSQLIQQGFTPQRTVLLAFGHDEEVGGEHGAGEIVKLLKSRGVTPQLVLDEGGLILKDGIGSIGSGSSNSGDTSAGNNNKKASKPKATRGITLVPHPVALIGTAEKGWQNWVIKVSGKAGHSSMPPTGQGTSVAAIIARILTNLEKRQTSTRLAPPVTDWLKFMAPHVQYAPLRLLLSYADSRVVSPLIAQLFGATTPELSAMVRSTVAVVKVHAGGEAHNVMPGDGEIGLNVRVLAGDDEATVKEYLDNIVYKELPHVSVEKTPGGKHVNASPVAHAPSPEFELIARAVGETFRIDGKQPIPMPYLLVGGTDSRWYTELAQGKVFRFSPIAVDRSAGDLERIHGINERLSVEAYLDLVRFYMRFVKLSTGSDAS